MGDIYSVVSRKFHLKDETVSDKLVFLGENARKKSNCEWVYLVELWDNADGLNRSCNVEFPRACKMDYAWGSQKWRARDFKVDLVLP